MNGTATAIIGKSGRGGIPALRRHASGNFFWREKGVNVYVGKDAGKAERAWQAKWGAEVAARSTEASSPLPARPSSRSLHTVNDVAARLWELVEPTVSKEKAAVYRYDLAPFLAKHGGKRLDELSPDDLLSYRADLCRKYKGWTVKGRLSIVRRLLTLADELGWVDRPYRMGFLKAPALGETKSKAWTAEEVSRKIKTVAAKNPNLARMLRLQWLTALRPFSVPEICNQRGTFEEPNVFVLDRSKTEKKTGEKQRVCLSPSALKELKRIKPTYQIGQENSA